MGTKPKNIIIADDDRDDIEMFESALSLTCKNYKLHKAMDGEELLLLLERIEDADLVVLDLNMPKLSGRDCLLWIRKNKKTADLPVLMFSTSNSGKDKLDCIESGANKYIVKPESFDALKNITVTICNNSWLN